MLSEVMIIIGCYVAALKWQMEDTFQLYMIYEDGIVRVMLVTAKRITLMLIIF